MICLANPKIERRLLLFAALQASLPGYDSRTEGTLSGEIVWGERKHMHATYRSHNMLPS
jgi:hypothetical protein